MPPTSSTARGPARLILLGMLAVAVVACSPQQSATAPPATPGVSTPSAITGDGGPTQLSASDASTQTPDPAPGGATPPVPAVDLDPAEACGSDEVLAAMHSGSEQGTVEGMATAPAGIAASANPVLTTFVAAVNAADLGDTLNRAGALTILAPTDCAFAGMDPATLAAAMADPHGQLTTMLGYHIIAGEQIPAADLTGSHTTFTGETITIHGTDVDGQATIVLPDVGTTNATLHLIDAVLVPASMQQAETEG